MNFGAKRFSFMRPTKCLVWLSLAPVLSTSPLVFALTSIEAGQTLTIDQNTAPDNYRARNGGVLNANGANTFEVLINSGSQFNALGGTYAGRLGNAGISVSNASANVSDAVVTGDRMGMFVGRESGTTTGSTVVVSGSRITGQTSGIDASGGSDLQLTDTHLTGTRASGIGLNSFGAEVRAKGGSMIGGMNGIRLRPDNEGVGNGANVSLDNVQVQGLAGSAILATSGVDAQIEVLNGTRLLAGNSVLLDVEGASRATMNVVGSTLEGNISVADNSSVALTFNQGNMVGDVLVQDGSSANVTLQNNSQLTGRLDKVNGVTINSGSNWTLTGNDSIGTLAMNGGRVSFGAQDVPDTFYNLNVGTLAGTGVFAMKGDFDHGGRDFLNVSGVATGNFDLAVTASGLDAASPQALTLVRTAAGDAHFALQGGPVDVGTWSYGLSKTTNQAGESEWFLDPATKTVSPGARSVLALFSAPTTVMLAEGATLRSRMGELRFNGTQPGLWMRTYSNKYNIAAGSGVAYQQTQRGLSLGADVRLGDSQWLAGVMGGYSDTDLSVEQGTSGTIKSYYFGPYVTWLDADSGYYFDALLKFNRFNNDAKVTLSDGSRAKGDYHNSGVGVSAEFGRNIKLDDGYFVEPYTRLTMDTIEGSKYALNNGMQADGDRARSVLGEAGATLGRRFDMGNGMVAQPYVRAAVQHEFINNNRVTVNDNNQFNNDLSGSRGQLGAGVALALSKGLQVHGDLGYSKGKNIEQPYGVNVGLRWDW